MFDEIMKIEDSKNPEEDEIKNFLQRSEINLSTLSKKSSVTVEKNHQFFSELTFAIISSYGKKYLQAHI